MKANGVRYVCALCNRPFVEMTCRELRLMFPKALPCPDKPHKHAVCRTEHPSVPMTVEVRP